MTSTSELLSRAVEDLVPAKLAQEKLNSGKPFRLYLGIDPTGTRLHLGHSVPLRKLKAFVDSGHHVIFLIGSFTAMIGDPSGRDIMRAPLAKEQVMKNFETYKEQAGKILDFSKVEIRYNHEWLETLGFSDILKLASNFTLQQMMKRDMFQRRLKNDDPISLSEFMYPLMVGYDSVTLDVDCEIGGNDQLFNMLAGRTLQQSYRKRDKFVLTTRLIEGTDGRKMSKTYDNCIWLTDDANDMYGKLMRIKDDLILTYMECVTEMPMSDVEEASKQLKAGANPKELKMRLAREVVELYHGKNEAEKAEKEFQSVFSRHELPSDIPEISAKKGSLLINILAEHKLVSSKSEARRLMEQGGLKLNDKPVTDQSATVQAGTYKVGKRKFVKIRD